GRRYLHRPGRTARAGWGQRGRHQRGAALRRTRTTRLPRVTTGEILTLRLSSLNGVNGLDMPRRNGRRVRLRQPVAVDRGNAYEASSLYASVAALPARLPADLPVRRRVPDGRLHPRLLRPA